MPEDKTAEPTAIQILNNQSHGFNKGQTESALKAMHEFGNLRFNKAIEETVKLLEAKGDELDPMFQLFANVLISELNKKKV